MIRVHLGVVLEQIIFVRSALLLLVMPCSPWASSVLRCDSFMEELQVTYCKVQVQIDSGHWTRWMLNAAVQYSTPDRPNFRANFTIDRLVCRSQVIFKGHQRSALSRHCRPPSMKLQAQRITVLHTALLEIPIYFVTSLAANNWISTSSKT
jgi:hypothetical protein